MTDFDTLSALLVEPSSIQAKIIENQLRQLGVISVDHAASGQDALSAMRQHEPGVVLSAMYLPDMSGTELVQAMRHDAQLETIPFVLISSETRPHVLDPVRQSGVCGILPKPFSQDQLRASLQATMDLISSDSSITDASDLDLESVRVLVVDDSPMARKFIRRVLENLGIGQFLEAENGAQAAQLLDRSMVDLVVTDYNMPEMDGQALIEHIRTRSWQQTVPVIMVSSETNEGRLSAVQNLGVVGICDKPFEPATVKGLLRNLLG